MVFIERMCVRRWLVGLSISVLLCICVSAAVNSTIRICVSTAVNSTFHHCLYRLFVSGMCSDVWICLLRVRRDAGAGKVRLWGNGAALVTLRTYSHVSGSTIVKSWPARYKVLKRISILKLLYW